MYTFDFVFVHEMCISHLHAHSTLNPMHNHYVVIIMEVRTCGTHFGETKLVASITGSPASESMSIRRIFTSAGTMV